MNTKKEILKEMVKSVGNQLISNKITEQYISRKLILSPNRAVEINLGKLQAEIKENRSYLEFLEEKLKEENEKA